MNTNTRLTPTPVSNLYISNEYVTFDYPDYTKVFSISNTPVKIMSYEFTIHPEAGTNGVKNFSFKYYDQETRNYHPAEIQSFLIVNLS